MEQERPDNYYHQVIEDLKKKAASQHELSKAQEAGLPGDVIYNWSDAKDLFILID